MCMRKFLFINYVDAKVDLVSNTYLCSCKRATHIFLSNHRLQVLSWVFQPFRVKFLPSILLYFTVPWFNYYHNISIGSLVSYSYKQCLHLSEIITDTTCDIYIYCCTQISWILMMTVGTNRRNNTAVTFKSHCPNLKGTQSIKISM